VPVIFSSQGILTKFQLRRALINRSFTIKTARRGAHHSLTIYLKKVGIDLVSEAVPTYKNAHISLPIGPLLASQRVGRCLFSSSI